MVITPEPHVVLGGHKQIVLGLKPEAPLVLSHYTWVESKANEQGSSTNVYAQRLGYAATRVKNDVINNQVVDLFETDGRLKLDKGKEFDVGIGASETAWINQKSGHIYRQRMTVEIPRIGERTVEAIYGTKTVELSIREGDKVRDLTLNVEGGCQPFFDRFKPMVVDGKVVLREKSFYVLDPYTLSYKKGSVSVGSRFEITVLLKKVKGNLYRFRWDGQDQRIYITDQNDLVKVDLTDKDYLQVDAVPMKR